MAPWWLESQEDLATKKAPTGAREPEKRPARKDRNAASGSEPARGALPELPPENAPRTDSSGGPERPASPAPRRKRRRRRSSAPDSEGNSAPAQESPPDQKGAKKVDPEPRRDKNRDPEPDETQPAPAKKRGAKKEEAGQEDAGQEDAGQEETGQKEAGQKEAGQTESGSTAKPKRRTRRRSSKKQSSDPASDPGSERADRTAPETHSSAPAPRPTLDSPAGPGTRSEATGDDDAATDEHGYEDELEPMAGDAASNVIYVPDRSSTSHDERKIAMFVDFENVALGVRDSEIKTFDVALILERLLEKGKIIAKRAYADWERYSDAKRQLHEAAIELIDIPQKRYSGKNSADIKMVVDAMDLCYSKDHLDTFVLVSGDSDFSPLVSKLKENDKYVIGMGVKNASSQLLVDNCDEFIYYEDVWRDTQSAPRLDHLPPKQAECFRLMSEAMLALFRENKDVIWGSMLKQTMQRKRPSFSESYYGYETFSQLLRDAERKGIVRLRRDHSSGNVVVIGFSAGSRRRDS